MTPREYVVNIPDTRIDGATTTRVKLTVAGTEVTAHEGPLPLDVTHSNGRYVIRWHDGNDVCIYLYPGVVVALFVDPATDYWPPLHVERVDEVAA